jgi:hypothetical protein
MCIYVVLGRAVTLTSMTIFKQLTAKDIVSTLKSTSSRFLTIFPTLEKI